MRSIVILASLALSCRSLGGALAAAPKIGSSSGGVRASDSKIAKNVLESKGEGYCSPSGPIENTLCAYETIESLNRDLYPALHSLVESEFFRYYKVDLYRECPFWYENGFCMNRDCGVVSAEESHIPEKWRTKALSQVIHDDCTTTSSLAPGCSLHAADFCYTDSEDSSEGQYIDLLSNPERFTGYAGESAHRVWGAIYEENCFGLSERVEGREGAVWGSGAGVEAGKIVEGGGASDASGGAFLQGYGTDMRRPQARDEECVEKRMYYRIISGLHASISIHICHDYLDQETGEWKPNLSCFISRLASHPERLSNVYFNAVLLLRAIARAAPYLDSYDIETASSKNDFEGGNKDKRAKWIMRQVLSMARTSGTNAFDEKALFQGPDALELRDQFKYNFRNVSRILDCTGCDKCRLWGKLQVSGLGTALKILFELDEQAFDPKLNPNLLQRSEVVALFNTLHRISESLEGVETFRRMYAETQEAEAERMAAITAAEAIAAASRPSHHPAKKLRRKKGKSSTSSKRPILSQIEQSLHRWLSKISRGCQESWTRCVRGIVNGPLRGLLGVGVGHQQSEGKSRTEL